MNTLDIRISVDREHGTISAVAPEGLILLKSLRKSGHNLDDIDFLRSILDEN